MIPDLPHLSDPAMPASFKAPYDRHKVPLVDYARGGVNLNDASKGLNVKDWQCIVDENSGSVYISAQGIPPMGVETLPGKISWISMAFDQNMHYNLAYTLQDEGSFLYWYDTAVEKYVTESLGDVRTPILRMDDVRDGAFADRSLILSYIRGGALCVRVQNDRFGVEYLLARSAGSMIIQCGMNVGMRFQWYCA